MKDVLESGEEGIDEVVTRAEGAEGAEGTRTEAREPTRPLICLSAALVALSTAR